MARQISVRSGVPQEVPAFTVNKACASGMKSIALAYQAILLGDANCILAGGTESMSRVPYYLDKARWGYRLGNQELVDGMYRDGFFCPLAKMVMGETGRSAGGAVPDYARGAGRVCADVANACGTRRLRRAV